MKSRYPPKFYLDPETIWLLEDRVRNYREHKDLNTASVICKMLTTKKDYERLSIFIKIKQWMWLRK